MFNIDNILLFTERLEANAFSEIQNNVLYFSIMIAAIFGKLKESSKRNILSAWIMYFIGTFFHELSHLIVSLLTNGKPRWFSILPSKQTDEKTHKTYYTLGYVLSKNVKWYNALLISMAPLLLIPLSFFVYENFFNIFEENLYTYIFYIFAIVSLLFSAIPSSVDFSNVFAGKTFILNFIPLAIVIAILIILKGEMIL